MSASPVERPIGATMNDRAIGGFPAGQIVECLLLGNDQLMTRQELLERIIDPMLNVLQRRLLAQPSTDHLLLRISAMPLTQDQLYDLVDKEESDDPV